MALQFKKTQSWNVIDWILTTCWVTNISPFEYGLTAEIYLRFPSNEKVLSRKELKVECEIVALRKFSCEYKKWLEKNLA